MATSDVSTIEDTHRGKGEEWGLMAQVDYIAGRPGRRLGICDAQAKTDRMRRDRVNLDTCRSL
jgi:hypothetical protein